MTKQEVINQIDKEIDILRKTKELIMQIDEYDYEYPGYEYPSRRELPYKWDEWKPTVINIDY